MVEHMFNLVNFMAGPRLRVMIRLAKDPMKDFYQRELSRVSKVSIGATNQILRQLAKLGFVTQEKRGRMYFYRLNLKNPVARQFKILLSIDGIYGLVREMAKNTRKIVLLGSSAEGTDVAESDIDLFVLTDQKEYVRRKISDFNRKSDRRIVPIIVDANELVKMRRQDRPLYERIERGIVLWQEE